MRKHTFKPKKPSLIERTNGRRADCAEFAVEAACRARCDRVEINVDGIGNLIADLAHLCDREGLDFAAITATATRDWQAER